MAGGTSRGGSRRIPPAGSSRRPGHPFHTRGGGFACARRARTRPPKAIASASSTATAMVIAIASGLIDASTAGILSACPATALPAGIAPPTVKNLIDLVDVVQALDAVLDADLQVGLAVA